MLGQGAATKPSRSDELLDADEQIRIANQIRAQFDALAPKRPIKPSRSESDQNRVDSNLFVHDIPELDKFQSLQSRSDATISAEGITDAQEEFVETQYYKELTSIDKQHHTTGSGFIKAVKEGSENGYEIKLQGSHVNGGQIKLGDYRSNPATNDWVPNIDQHQAFVSSKPNRSESS